MPSQTLRIGLEAFHDGQVLNVDDLMAAITTAVALSSRCAGQFEARRECDEATHRPASWDGDIPPAADRPTRPPAAWVLNLEMALMAERGDNRILDHHAQLTLCTAFGAGVDDDIAPWMPPRKGLMAADIARQSSAEIGGDDVAAPHPHEHIISMKTRGDTCVATAAQRALVSNGVGQNQRTVDEISATQTLQDPMQVPLYILSGRAVRRDWAVTIAVLIAVRGFKYEDDRRPLYWCLVGWLPGEEDRTPAQVSHILIGTWVAGDELIEIGA
jgi:hypothetical protein